MSVHSSGWTVGAAHTSDEPDGIVDDVDTLAPGDLQDLLLPSFLRVVDAVICARPARDVELLLRACSRDDLCPQR